MSNRENPSTMTDVDLARAWDGSIISITIYDGDDDDLDNLLHQGYEVTGIVTIL